MNHDQTMMQLAINAAKEGRFLTWQNPMVGAAVVKDGHVLALGHHVKYGAVHAERNAIEKLTPEQLFNATLYVTLEPCNHQGKQPPCSELIIHSKIKRVVIGQTDPHALVTGKGIARLKTAGIEVVTGVLADQAAALNPFYTYFFQHHQPWITLKQAISLDLKLSLPGQRITLSSSAALKQVHFERANYQGILIGSETAIIDDPSLLTTVKSPFPPIRMIIDRRGRLRNHPNLKLLTDGFAPTRIFTQNNQLGNHQWPAHVKVISLADGQLSSVIDYLTDQGIQSLYVEGGRRLHQAFCDAGLGNELITYLAPVTLGANGVPAYQPKAGQLIKPSYQFFGNTIRIQGGIQNV